MVIMMTCNDIRQLIPFMDDDEYRDERMIEAERHLHQCDACMKEYRQTHAILATVRDTVSDYAVSDSTRYLAEVRRRISVRKRRHLIAYRVIPAMAAAFLIVAVGLYSIMFNPTYNNMVREELFNDEDVQMMDEYVAQQYFGVEEIYEMVDATEPEEELTVETAMNTYTYDDITPEDIILMLDDSEYDLIFASF